MRKKGQISITVPSVWLISCALHSITFTLPYYKYHTANTTAFHHSRERPHASTPS